MDQFSVGGVLSRSFSMWIKNFPALFLISGLIYLPGVLLQYQLNSGAVDVDSVQRSVLITSLVRMFLMLIATGSIAYAVFQWLRGQKASVGHALGIGFARFFPLLFAVVLEVVLLLLIYFGLALVGVLFAAIFAKASPVFAVIVLLLVVVIPWLAIYVRWYVVVPAVVVERPGATGALSRSSQLTEGHRWGIFGIMALMFILYFGSAILIGWVLKDSGGAVLTIVTALFEISLGSLGSVATAVVYHDLRVSKEGVGADQLAQVFE